jgi:hypothetical protein
LRWTSMRMWSYSISMSSSGKEHIWSRLVA